MRIAKIALGIAAATAMFSTPVLADDEIFQGRVTDANNTLFIEGAQVEIKELNLSTVSKRDGSFRFSAVPEGQYTLKISYLGVPASEKPITIVHGGNEVKSYIIGREQQVMENVIVYGQRAGQAGALNRQRNSGHLTSIVSAAAIGQLPDQNAAEALQRLPGMFIQRDQGEGRFVGIRGIDPNLNNVTINGVNVPSPEAGVRSVAMDVIPSELIQSLEVSKTTTPDMDASAVGGSIEVKSLSAFDRQDESYSVTMQSSYNALFEDFSPKMSGSYSNTFDLDGGSRLGVAGALSYFERKFGSHNVETDGGWSDFEFEDSATGDDVEVFGAEEIEQRYYEITRERLGAALNFDLATSDKDKYFLRTLYSEFADDEYRLRNEYKFEKGAIDMASYSATSARFIDAAMDRDTKDRFEEQKILSVVAGGENLVDDYLVEYEVGYSKSSESEPNRVDVDFKGKDFALGYDVRAGAPVLTQDAAAHDLSNFEMDEIAYENNYTKDTQTSFKIDVSRDFVWNNHNAQWKVGVKQTNREKNNDVNVTIYDGGFDDVFASDFATPEQAYELGTFGPGIEQATLRKYVMDNRSAFDINANESAIENAGNSYTSNEDIFAGYAMLTIDMGKWHIIGGVRYESTSFDTAGNKVELVVDEINDDESVNITPWQVSKDYNHLMPSLNIRYNISDDLLTRFAYTQTIARPTFGNAAAFQVIESEITEDDGVVETERKAEVGNPELDPYESNNIDWTIEYYPGHIGVLSAGVFYKDIDNFIEQQEVQDNGAWNGYKEVLQHVNGGSAELTGLELAWHKSFDSGLMLGANGTFVDANRDMPNLAEEVANVMIGFENSQISVRLSATYKSESYQFKDGDGQVFEDSHSQIDFSGKYYLSDTMHLYFNAVNLTDEPYYLYHSDKSYNYQYEQYGRSFELGFTLTSF